MCAQVNVQAPAGTEKSEGGINKIEKLPTKDEKEEKPGYKSQSNGLAENANRTLSKLLRSASTDHQLAWFRMLTFFYARRYAPTHSHLPAP